MQRTKWTERKFTFDFPEGWMMNIIERLAGTAPRLYEVLESVSETDAEEKLNDKWSIKEHVGHLVDLEELHDGRITDFLLRKSTLRAADMSNAKTEAANHNSKTKAELIEAFIKKRAHFLHRLRMLDDDTQLFRSLHPRLNIPMRPIDVAYFTAEHDDHHLASIRELVEIHHNAKHLF